MSSDGHLVLPSFQVFARISSGVRALADLDSEIRKSLDALALPVEKLRGRRIAVTAGSRGIANLREIVRGICGWLKEQGAQPFVFPAMGSHGGGTAEGQRKILEEYGVTADSIGAEIRSSMETVSLGTTPEGIEAYMDRNAWEADGVLVMNRIKPHTGFSGKIESGLVKMMAIGMGKLHGAESTHRASRKFGYESSLRAVATQSLASGKILCGLGVIENEQHQICALRAALPADIVASEEAALELAKKLVPRLPVSKLHLLIVDEMGKNISGTGMDTKVIGRGYEPAGNGAPDIRLIYARDLTPESGGNALGIGMIDIIHERLYRKIDLGKIYLNVRTSLSVHMARVPMYLPSDREALDFALESLGSPAPEEQRVAWIRNTLGLDRIAVSETLARELARISGWRALSQHWGAQFDAQGNLPSPW